MTMAQFQFSKIIDDFVAKTGDSPTHILVTQSQWEELKCPQTYEHSVSCCLDYLVVNPIGTYHYPEFPIVAQLPQFFKKPDLVMVKLGKYKVIREA